MAFQVPVGEALQPELPLVRGVRILNIFFLALSGRTAAGCRRRACVRRPAGGEAIWAAI